MLVMEKPKRKKVSGAHKKPRRMVALWEELAVVLEDHARKRLKTLTEQVRDVCMSYAIAEGIWPPKKPAP